MTRGAVRSCARLGLAQFRRRRCAGVRITPRLAGRATTGVRITLRPAGRAAIADERLEVRESIAVRGGQNAGGVEGRGRTKGEKVAVRSAAAPPRGSDAELASTVEPKAWNRPAARSPEQTGRRRGIGSLEVRERPACEKSDSTRLGKSSWLRFSELTRLNLTTPSSATAERGAVAAWWSEVKAYGLRKKVARSEDAQARVSSYRDTRSRSLQRMVRRCGHSE